MAFLSKHYTDNWSQVYAELPCLAVRMIAIFPVNTGMVASWCDEAEAVAFLLNNYCSQY